MGKESPQFAHAARGGAVWWTSPGSTHEQSLPACFALSRLLRHGALFQFILELIEEACPSITAGLPLFDPPP
ncbi:uncharacterized protein UV8b_04973 [Ustilaginoidea virens]|uniref:Uncharacterized protein n=1 Tax=Ustilaginoidea virens TaxID=1159556 RepID=A0A8E5MI76_USTVR|nr:uncharacterized protein UV8b_04973 [Ustilaginoidea virens]QUC20732.1 hypothetical protein UV8b_04973 [Ustilaginoidea virens]